VIYEIGLQQQLGEEFALDLTGYFKDIRNLLGTQILQTVTGIRYARYINRDYGNVRGFTVSFEKQQLYSGGVGATVDYTFQIAKGNASDPNSAFLDAQANREPAKELVPLGKLKPSVFVRVYNLFDRKNELQVFSDTGRANYSLSALTSGTIFGLNTTEEFFTRPDFYSEPRQVLAGFEVEF
jgi:outer membrane receptor protein involved in Fe transport